MIAPIPAQAAMAISDATQGFTPFRNSSPAITIASAVTDPTDRSIPPEISRIVMPTTTIASTEKAIVIARMFVQVRKCGLAKDMITKERQDDQHEPGFPRAEQARQEAAVLDRSYSLQCPGQWPSHRARQVS